MKRLCLHIQKGGVGKTSLSGNVGACLARRGFKTLLVDCDLQGNLSSWFFTDDIEHDLADVLSEKASLEKASVSIGENLYLLPVAAIGGQLQNWSETQLPLMPRAFEFLNNDIEKLGFDFVIYDCSPSFSMLERTVIGSVDEVINPLSPEFFSVDGIEIFTHELRRIETANRKKITNDKIIVNMVNMSFAGHKAFLKQLKKLKYRLFTMPQDRKIAESQIAHQSVFDYAPDTKSVAVFEEITDAVSKV
jgi:cellulose biosynthesis protein BcsQ